MTFALAGPEWYRATRTPYGMAPPPRPRKQRKPEHAVAEESHDASAGRAFLRALRAIFLPARA